MDETKIVALIKYHVEGDLYGKIVFTYDGQYCVEQDNYGDITLEQAKHFGLGSDAVEMCYELGVDASTPIEDCEQDIIDAYLSALEDEDELQYLDDPSSTYLEY